MKKAFALLLALVLVLTCTGCGRKQLTDGSYHVDVTLEGGSGKAHIEDAVLEIRDGKITAYITWSSPYYDFMIIDGVTYAPINEEGNSVFAIPAVLDQDMAVSADTVAMSQPHLIDYTLHFDSRSLEER